MAVTSGTTPQTNMGTLHGENTSIGFRVVWRVISSSGTTQTVNFSLQGISTPWAGAGSSNVVVRVRNTVRYNSGNNAYYPGTSWGTIATWNENFGSGASFNINISASAYWYSSSSITSPTYTLPVLASGGTISSITNPMTMTMSGASYTINVTSGTNVSRNLHMSDGLGVGGGDLYANGIGTSYTGRTGVDWASNRQNVKSFGATATVTWMSGSTQIASASRGTTVNIPKVSGLGIQSANLGVLTVDTPWNSLAVQGLSNINIPAPTTDNPSPKYWSVSNIRGSLNSTGGSRNENYQLNGGTRVKPTDYGTYTASFTVTDSRGYSEDTNNSSITVYPYNPPTFGNVTIKRTTSDVGINLESDPNITQTDKTKSPWKVFAGKDDASYTIQKDSNGNFIRINLTSKQSAVKSENIKVTPGVTYNFALTFRTSASPQSLASNTVMAISWRDSSSNEISSSVGKLSDFFTDITGRIPNKWYRLSSIKATAPSGAASAILALGDLNLPMKASYDYKEIMFSESSKYGVSGKGVNVSFAYSGTTSINGISTSPSVDLVMIDSNGNETRFPNVTNNSILPDVGLDPLSNSLTSYRLELFDIVSSNKSKVIRDTSSGTIDLPSYIPPSFSSFIINYDTTNADNNKDLIINFSIDPNSTEILYGSPTNLSATLSLDIDSNPVINLTDPKNGYTGIGTDVIIKTSGMSLNAQMTMTGTLTLQDDVSGIISITPITITSLFVFVDFDRGFRDKNTGLIKGGVGIGKVHENGILDVEGDMYNTGVNYSTGGFVISGNAKLPTPDTSNITRTTKVDQLVAYGNNSANPYLYQDYSFDIENGLSMKVLSGSVTNGKVSLTTDQGLKITGTSDSVYTTVTTNQVSVNTGVGNWVTLEPLNGVTTYRDFAWTSFGSGSMWMCRNGFVTLSFKFTIAKNATSYNLGNTGTAYAPRTGLMTPVRLWTTGPTDFISVQINGLDGGNAGVVTAQYATKRDADYIVSGEITWRVY